MASDSDLLAGLNGGDETPDGPTWVSIWTTQDETVTPPDSARLDGALNLTVQSVCADARVGHGDLPRESARAADRAGRARARGAGGRSVRRTAPASAAEPYRPAHGVGHGGARRARSRRCGCRGRTRATPWTASPRGPGRCLPRLRRRPGRIGRRPARRGRHVLRRRRPPGRRHAGGQPHRARRRRADGPDPVAAGKPVIAAIAGHAVAGGLELALWCDLRVADETAVLGVYCRRWGVPLIDGGTVRLPRLIGASRAMDLVLTGRSVDAARGAADRAGQPGGAARPGARRRRRRSPGSSRPSRRPACAATGRRCSSRTASTSRPRSPTSSATA